MPPTASGRPKASNLDLYLIIATDASNFRTGTDTQADRKAAQRRAPVYKYHFQWYSPVRGGALRAMHTMDIPFVFENYELAAVEVGSGPELKPLGDRMAGAWVAFATTGNPNHPLHPEVAGLRHRHARHDGDQQRLVGGERSVRRREGGAGGGHGKRRRGHALTPAVISSGRMRRPSSSPLAEGCGRIDIYEERS